MVAFEQDAVLAANVVVGPLGAAVFAVVVVGAGPAADGGVAAAGAGDVAVGAGAGEAERVVRQRAQVFEFADDGGAAGGVGVVVGAGGVPV